MVFDTLDDEISALVVLDMLNFGSGYKRELACAQIGRYKFGGYGSAFVCMLEGTEAAARAGPLGAARLAAWSAADTERFFRLPAALPAAGPAPNALAAAPAACAAPAHALVPAPMLAALVELNGLVTSALRSAGSALLACGHDSPGSFVLGLLQPAHRQGSEGAPEAAHRGQLSTTQSHNEPDAAPLHAARLVEALARTLPPFADFAAVPAPEDPADAEALPTGLPILKKAQLLAASLHTRIGVTGREPRLRLEGLELLTVAADPVLPAVLHAEGCLVYAQGLEARIRGGTELEPGPDETAIRASAIAACEAIRAAVGAGIVTEVESGVSGAEPAASFALSASQLDLLLWGVLGKSERHRHAPRHVTKRIWWH